jgi:hypothetical protein
MAGSPITISGPDTGDPALFVGRSGANTVSIVESSHVTVRNLVLDGRGLVVDGVKAEGHSAWAHHITLENLRIVNHHADQQIVGISAQCPAWGWVIRGNTIIGAGTGMYLGRWDGSGPFVAALIEHNVIIDTIGYNLQIKHQGERPRIKGMPEGKNVTIIRHNVFSKSENSARDKMARPNLLVGHWPPRGPESEDTYAIYGNFFYQNPSEALFQGEGNVAFYSNVLVNTFGDAVNVQPHNAIPRRIDVFHNTVLAAGTGIRVSGGDPAFSQRVVGNAVFAKEPLVGGEQHANRTGSVEGAAEYLIRPYAALGELDLAPLPGKLAASYARLPQLDGTELPDVNRDFEGRAYVRPLAGAYAAGNSTWRLMLERKR